MAIMEPHLQRYLDWYSTRDLKDKSGEIPASTKKLLAALEMRISTKEGRTQIATALVDASKKRLEQQRLSNSQKNIKRYIIELESFIGILTDEERFSPPIMSLRRSIFDLCNILMSRYGVVESVPNEYQGQRMTRFERILNTDDEEEPPSDPDLQLPPLVQAIL